MDSLDADEVENIKLNFNSVAGNEEAKESVKDIVDFLKTLKNIPLTVLECLKELFYMVTQVQVKL